MTSYYTVLTNLQCTNWRLYLSQHSTAITLTRLVLGSLLEQVLFSSELIYINNFIIISLNRLGGFIIAPDFDIKSLKINGMNISYMDRPAKDDQQPTLVFVHGFTNQKVVWIPLLRQLPSSWRIIAFDLPGHGESGFSEDFTYFPNTLVDLMHKVSDWKNIIVILYKLCNIAWSFMYM